MRAQYGSKGKKVFYASKNKGTIKGVKEETQMNWQNKLYESLLENENMSDDEKRQVVGTRKGQQKGLRPLGGKSKRTRDYINKAGERVFVTTLPSGETKRTTVKNK